MSGIQAEKIKGLIEKREEARKAGGDKKVASQHEKGKLTARERIKLLLDPNSFEEFDMFVTHRCQDFEMERSHLLGDGVVTSFRRILPSTVALYPLHAQRRSAR